MKASILAFRKEIIDAYIKIRTIDNTIPDDVLDFMKKSAIEALTPALIAVTVEGGQVQAVGSNKLLAQVAIIDYDNIEGGDGVRIEPAYHFDDIADIITEPRNWKEQRAYDDLCAMKMTLTT